MEMNATIYSNKLYIPMTQHKHSVKPTPFSNTSYNPTKWEKKIDKTTVTSNLFQNKQTTEKHNKERIKRKEKNGQKKKERRDRNSQPYNPSHGSLALGWGASAENKSQAPWVLSACLRSNIS